MVLTEASYARPRDRAPWWLILAAVGLCFVCFRFVAYHDRKQVTRAGDDRRAQWRTSSRASRVLFVASIAALTVGLLAASDDPPWLWSLWLGFPAWVILAWVSSAVDRRPGRDGHHPGAQRSSPDDEGWAFAQASDVGAAVRTAPAEAAPAQAPAHLVELSRPCCVSPAGVRAAVRRW